MFGQDTGGRPGEFQTWVEQRPLLQKLPFPQGYRDLRHNPDKGVLGIVTGVGTAREAASIMALGMDPRFDLSKAYWLVAGIAGVNPNEGSIGSAAWAEWVVDGDLGFEIDAREIPAGWPTGFIPLGKAQPYEEPATDIGGAVYHLNPKLVDWAYELTKKCQARRHRDNAKSACPLCRLLRGTSSARRGDHWRPSRMQAGPIYGVSWCCGLEATIRCHSQDAAPPNTSPL